MNEELVNLASGFGFTSSSDEDLCVNLNNCKYVRYTVETSTQKVIDFDQ